MQNLLADIQYAFVQTTCGSIFRLTTTVNMLNWRLKTELHRPNSRINSFIIGIQTIVKLLTIVSIASATIVILKKHYCSALVITSVIGKEGACLVKTVL